MDPDLNKLYNGIHIIKSYKNDFVSIGKNKNQKNHIKSYFAKYYIASKKDEEFGVFPVDDIFNIQFSKDLVFSNTHKNTNFDIPSITESAGMLFERYKKDYMKFKETVFDTLPIVNKIDLNHNKYSRLCNLYNGDTEQFSYYVHILTELYHLIEISDTIHLSIPPIFIGVELFGSCINTHNKYFCSVFEIERIFGSLGSFWDYSFHMSNLYLCNPPFDETIIENMAVKLIKDLTETKYHVVVVISIPVWDNKSQRSIQLKEYNMHFSGYEKLINNEFLMEKVILNKDEYKYWNYDTGKSVASSYTHLIVLSNLDHNAYKKTFNLHNFTEMWRQFSSYV